jgi:two-component system, sensor histidine kinase YesM
MQIPILSGLWEKSTFKIKMTLGLSMIVLITVFMITYFSYRIYARLFESELSEQFAIANEQMMARIGFEVADLYRMSNSVMFNPQVEKLLKQLSENHSLLDKFVMQRDLTNLLIQIKYDYTQVRAIYLLDQEGVNRYFGHIQNLSISLEPALTKKLQAQLEDSNSDSVWMLTELPVMREEQTDLHYLFVRKMYNNTLETYGTMVMVLDPMYFQSFFDDELKNTGHEAFLFDNRNQLLYTNNPGSNVEHSELLNESKARSGPNRIDSYLYTHNSSDTVGFSLVSRISLSELNYKYQEIMEKSLIFAGIGIAISVLFVMLLSKRLLHPLKLLVQAMSRLRQGDFDERIHIQTKDELSFIGQGFNDMASHIKALINEVYIRQISEREAELKAYQAQFNPHFLHNTLNGLYWKLFMENNKDSARLVSSLAELLKYSLESVSNRTTLQEEMQQIRNYLNIQRAFMEEDLESIVQVDEDVLDCEVFRLLLQPLVENVFVHAFRNHTGPKLLMIRGYRDAGNLKIEITDNGCGMDEDVIASILAPDKQPGESREKLGVRIVVRRIALLYGGHYGIRYLSEPGKGTNAQIVLPLIAAERQEE